MAAMKYSRQREAILLYLRSTTSHPTAEKIYRIIQKEFPKISLGTVYRNLNLLADKGEILRFNCGDGVEHFDATIEPHNHFICRKCQCVLDLQTSSMDHVDKEAEKDFSGEIEGHVVYFYGICSKCLSKNNFKGEIES
jgi:Fur family peroxide stress response transcriptional regulator